MFFPQLAQQILGCLGLPRPRHTCQKRVLAEVVNAKFEPVSRLSAAIKDHSHRNTLRAGCNWSGNRKLHKIVQPIPSKFFRRQSAQRCSFRSGQARVREVERSVLRSRQARPDTNGLGTTIRSGKDAQQGLGPEQ